MTTALTMGFLAMFILLTGFIGAELGLTQQEIVLFVPTEPGGSFIDTILAPFRWVFDAASSYFQLITFQAQGINPVIVTLIFWPVQIALVWQFIRLVRGGG